MQIAKTVCDELLYRTSPSAALVGVMRGLSYFVMGLGILIVLVAVPVIGMLVWNKVPVTNINVYINDTVIHVFTAFLAGIVGSVVSLLLRLNEFEVTRNKSKDFLRWYGASLPIVGGFFAIVIAAILDGKIIPFLNFSQWQMFIVIGFLSGFSERFTRNILDAIEVKVFKGH